MATNTTNFNLKKPAYSDTADIADINGNMDKVDSALNALGNGLAIMANGNTHAAITIGQYVYVHNHGSLSQGLYIATSNISANGTLSSSNLQAVSGGGLNTLSAVELSFSANVTATTQNYVFKRGKIIYCECFSVTTSADFPAWSSGTLAELPSDAVPTKDVFLVDVMNPSRYIQIATNGKIFPSAAVANGTTIRCASAVWRIT